MRPEIAQKYLKGQGIEIGALHFPTPIPEGTSVTYVDRPPAEVAHNHGDVVPQVKDWVIDDATALRNFASGSLDFVMAHHVLEHVTNPLLALTVWLRVLKPGGFIMFSLPNKDHCFDRERPITSFAHVFTDFMAPSRDRDLDHYVDWFMYSEQEGLDPNTAWPKAVDAWRNDHNIHFHVWDLDGMRELVAGFIGWTGTVGLVEERVNGGEVIYVLRKL